MRTRRSITERFWKKVDLRSADECWNWQGAKANYGYGILGRGGRGEGNIRAHVLSWEMANGRKVPVDMVVRHKCDNPACVNPAHLTIGTQRENMQDAMERNRGLGKAPKPGTMNGQAKITDDTARSMRAMFVPHKVTRKVIAQRFNVSESLVKKVIAGTTWRHVL